MTTLRPAWLTALLPALLFLRAAPAEATGCNTFDCLHNSAIAQAVQPTSVTADDRGDVTFFASQSGQLPNVMFVLDNSTSMYELPYSVNAFPNSAWVSQGQTPNGCGTVTTTAPASPCTGTAWGTPSTTGVAPTGTYASCHNNTFFEGLRYSADGSIYDRTRTYALPDPWFDGTHTPAIKYFNNTSVFAFMEWNSSSAGGTAGSGPISFTAGTGSGGTPPGPNPGVVSGSVNSDCAAMSSSGGSGGKGGTGNGAWSMTQQQRCQQCLDEAGYYIAPGASTTDNASGQILFKGNWLDFNPPKFIIARKTLTDFISNQSSSATPVRIGITTYDNQNVNSLDIPSTSTGFTGRNDGGHLVSSGMTPDCSVTNWTTGNGPTQQTSLLTAVRGISWGTTSAPIATPLAETLFNVGQFFSGDNTYYTNTFGAQWLKSEFTAPTGANKPLCVSCQVNAIVLITDGEPYGDNNLPAQFRTNTIQCPHTTGADPCGTDQSNGSANLLDDVTNFLATTDLNASLTGIQDVITFVIGVGLKVPLLDNAAKYGKSTSAVRADNSADLQQEIADAVVNIVSRATAFSSTAIQTLEVGTGSTAFVPRFVPGASADSIWEGHLFRFDLFNEFVAGVDKNGDGTLNDVFLVDKDGDIVTEDDKGAFFKQKNNAPAVPVWDAGAQLSVPGTYATRTIYTAVYDSTAAAWTTIPFTNTITDTNFARIKSYLGIDGTTACSQIQARMATPIPAAYLNSSGVFDSDHCAKAIIDYTRGYNVLQDFVPTPTDPTPGVNHNRGHMLGDIFHSSPVVVDPPVDQFICSLGLHSQCLSTLYQDQLSNALVTPTPSASYTVGSGASAKTVDAYEKFWEDHETRQRIVLVGANDGMLHAFDAGAPTTSPPTMAGTGFRQVVYGPGTGNELWAFVPPDQLPRLWRMMTGGHQLYMDGDIMVRDVWVDGAQNDKASAGFTNQSLVKQDVEFHTVAVASERQGGTHFVALDVTDTTTPKMLWIWPQPCSAEEQSWGQTFGQFSPRPPPIGPVLLETSNTAGQANYSVAHTEERWAVFLNGGHSPFANRGRGVALLDVYTGQPLWKASYNPSATDPSAKMRFGFAATAAMIDYGTGNSFGSDGFFDTAVLGDEGGQIWTFRFGTPGHIDSTTNLVNNWAFGRAYEPNSSASDDSRYHQPIYTVASTTVQPENGWLRAYVGTGDRSHVRSSGGGDCRPDDPMSCVNAGCTVSSALTLDSGTSHYASTFASAGSSSASSPTMASPTQAFSTVSTNACTTANASEVWTVTNCPSAAMNNNETITFGCSGSPYTCTDGAFRQPTPDGNRNTTSTVGANAFLSVAVLADAAGCSSNSRTHRLSVTSDQSTYDTNRLSAFNSSCADLVNVTATTATATSTSGNTAGRNSAGWFLTYPTIDEKTVTSSTILGGCVIWSSLIPSGGTVGCASAGATVAPFYQADALTGAPNCAASFLSGSNYVRSIQRNVLSPPPEPAASVAVGSGGTSMRFSTLEIQPGASEVTQMTVNTSTEMLQMLYSLPMSIDQHTCRHVDPTKCE